MTSRMSLSFMPKRSQPHVEMKLNLDWLNSWPIVKAPRIAAMEETKMPQFLDHHKASGPPPAEMVSQVESGLRSGHTDEASGVKGISWMYNDNEQWCVTEAPNSEAVHKYHEAMGLNLGAGDVTEIKVVR